MKIAVLSDIHGNMQALDAVLKDIEQNQCDEIFCLGDLALAGPEPDKTVDFVKAQNWTIIQGNTDKMIAECTDNLIEMTKKAFPAMGNSLEQDIKILKKENLEFLKKLPPQKSLEIEGVKILLVHGSPRRNNEDIMPNLPMENIEEIIAGVNEELILCGHTHIPCGYQTNSKKTVINVGSVGRPMTEDVMPCYLILDIKDGGFSAEHKFANYDRELASKLMRERNFEGADAISEMLIKQKSRHA